MSFDSENSPTKYLAPGPHVPTLLKRVSLQLSIPFRTTEKFSGYTTLKLVSHMDTIYNWAQNSNPESLVEIQNYDGQRQLYRIGRQTQLVLCLLIEPNLHTKIQKFRIVLGPQFYRVA